MSDLRDRVDDMRAWALNRIEWCQREEAKFSSGEFVRHPPGAIALEAATERRALQAVLRQLDGDDAAKRAGKVAR